MSSDSFRYNVTYKLFPYKTYRFNTYIYIHIYIYICVCVCVCMCVCVYINRIWY